MKRLLLRMLDKSGAANGQVPVWDDTTNQWKPGTATGSTDPEVVRDTMAAALVAGANVTITPNDAGDTITIAAAGGSGGGGSSTGRDRRWTVPTGATSVDEFNDDTLGTAWVRVDGTGAASGNVTWTEGADVLSYVQSSGDTGGSAFHALLRPLSAIGGSVAVGDAFVVGVQPYFPNANYPQIGIVLADGTTAGSGNQIQAGIGLDTSVSDMLTNLVGYTGFASNATGNQSPRVGVVRSAYTYIRLVCTATNVWRMDISPDGVGWLKHGGTLTRTITPTHVGLFGTTNGQSGTKFVASFDFIRRYSGVS